MKKIWFSFLFALHCFAIMGAEENVYTELLRILNRNNKMLAVTKAENNIGARMVQNEKLKWLPKLSLENSGAMIGFTQDRSANAFDLSSNLVLNQQLLLGSTLRLFANNGMRMLKGQNMKFNYGFSTGAMMNVPLYVFTPKLFVDAARSDFYSVKNEAHILQLKQQSITNMEMANALYYLGEYYVQREKIKLADEKLLLLKTLLDKKTVLWKEGKLSTVDLNESILAYEKTQSDVQALRMNFASIELKLLHCGLTLHDVPEHFECWITDWEKFVSAIRIERIAALDLKKLRLNSDWQQQVRNTMQSVPNLFLACNFQNVESAYGGYSDDFFKSIRNTFKRGQDFKWTVSLGMNIGFDIFTEKAQLNKNFADMKTVYRTQHAMLDDEYREQLAEAQNTVRVLRAVLQQKAETEKILHTRLDEAAILREAGKLSPYDYRTQELYVQEAALDLLRSRLNLVCYLIPFYQS